MGMYTGIRAKLQIKPEFAPVVEQLTAGADWCDVKTDDAELQNLIDDWARIGRCDFIPNGALSYMPWDDNDPEYQNRLEDGVWIFQCSLKNYEGEIEYFFENVLPYIVTGIIHLEKLYEEWSTPELYELRDGRVFLTQEHTNDY